MTDPKSWQQLAQEASVESDPQKLLSLICELNEALARDRRGRKKVREPQACPSGDKNGSLARQREKNDYGGILAGREGVSGKKPVGSDA